jgi:hypothetical protein
VPGESGTEEEKLNGEPCKHSGAMDELFFKGRVKLYSSQKLMQKNKIISNNTVMI